MAHDKSTARKHDISASQLFATALAAVTAAFLGSMLGTAGTVIGAGIASVVTTFAGALYQRSLDRTRTTLRTRVARFEPPTVRIAAPTDAPTVVLSPVAPAAARGRRLTWRVVVLATVAAFALGIGAVSGVELLRGHPNSGGTAGTSVGSLFGQPTGRPPVTHRPATTAPATSQPPTTTQPPATTTAPATTTPSATPSPSPAPTGTTPTGTTTPPPTTGAPRPGAAPAG